MYIATADLYVKNNREMKNKVFSCIYPFVKDIPDSPLSVELIVSAGVCTESEVKQIFDELKATGLLKRKHYFTHVYRLTPAGFDQIKEGWETYNKATSSDMELV
jgi:RIO-like serine/threonine protein kinase